ncbi:MAG: undecaprenyldiphospho-muramoylpentapeptide beta-N-acetylglucosaminyltransferase [Oscillospiraceae bacterium]|nr:undecaprenyldiphospho-muramoylpentapeptide beta-N-acetylglucosaminyltransferase [Oscillospiraceae bacterium]
MKILIACGGTGGHINPALAIAEIISEHLPEAEFLFIGTPDGMEAELVPAAGYEMDFVQSAGFQRSFSLENLAKNAKAVRYLVTAGGHAKNIIRGFQPQIAIGTGGYASGPVIRAAQQMGIPTVIHEQNAYPGVTNKLLAKKAAIVMLTFEAAKKYFPEQTNTCVTGLPVRGSMTRCTREEARAKLGIKDGMTILSFGGSQGAKCLNDLMPELMQWHLESDMQINHIHAFGVHGRDSVPQELESRGISDNARLRVTEYIHDMEICLAAADIVISRSGASTLSELEAVGRASILIPYPFAAEDHQYHNAMVLGNANAAIVIVQKDLTIDILKDHIRRIYENQEEAEQMGRNAAALYAKDTNDRIWNVVKDILKL